MRTLVLKGEGSAQGEDSMHLGSDTPVATCANTRLGGGGQALQNIGQLPTTAIALDVHNYLRLDLDGGRLSIRVIGLGGTQLDLGVLYAELPSKRVIPRPALP